MKIIDEVERIMNREDPTLFDEVLPAYVTGKIKRMSNRSQMRILNKYFAYKHDDCEEQTWLSDFCNDVILPLVR